MRIFRTLIVTSLTILLFFTVATIPVYAISNVALNKPATASAGTEPERAFDGIEGGYLESGWNAGAGPPQWIQVDLEADHYILKIRLLTDQVVAKGEYQSVHEIYLDNNLIHTLDVVAENHQWIEAEFDTPYLGREIRILTTVKDDWVAWKEIEVYGFPAQEPFPQDTMAPTGSVHAYDNLIWPPNGKMVAVTLEGYLMDEISVARDGGGLGISSAYLLINNTSEIILRGDTVDLLNANGHFNIDIEVMATKGAEYLIELHAADTNPEGPNSGLVDKTYIRVPHNMKNKSD